MQQTYNTVHLKVPRSTDPTASHSIAEWLTYVSHITGHWPVHVHAKQTPSRYILCNVRNV